MSVARTAELSPQGESSQRAGSEPGARDAAPLEPAAQGAALEAVVRGFPGVLQSLRRTYDKLSARAARMESELRVRNRELEAVLASLPCGVIVRAANGAIVRMNARALELVGARLDDGSTCEVRSGDGSRRSVCVRTSLVNGVGGSLGSVQILDDRTELEELSARLHRADKMAALGTLASGIAHEIRNPMNAIKGFASLLERGESDPKRARWASLIVQGCSEADAIIQNMLSFGSPERLRLEAIDPAQLAQSAFDAAFPAAADRARLTLATRIQAPAFVGDKLKLRQALRNLCANAAQAQAGFGAIEIAAEREQDEIVLSVSDAGPGVPAELRNKILDPFFTTHASGCGLGLALVTTIARLHGGGVEVRPERSQLGGALFQIRFPLHPPAEPVAALGQPVA